MKRWFSLFLIMVMCLVLVVSGCSDTTPVDDIKNDDINEKLVFNGEELTKEEIWKLTGEKYYEVKKIFFSGLDCDMDAITEDGWAPVTEEGFDNLTSLRAYCEERISPELAEKEFYNYYIDGGMTSVMYKDIEGRLYYTPADGPYSTPEIDSLEVVFSTERTALIKLHFSERYGGEEIHFYLSNNGDNNYSWRVIDIHEGEISSDISEESFKLDWFNSSNADSFTITKTYNNRKAPLGIQIGDSFSKLSHLHPDTYQDVENPEITGGYVLHAVSQYEYIEMVFVPEELYPRMYVEFEEGDYVTAVRIEYAPDTSTALDKVTINEPWVVDLYDKGNLLLNPFEFGDVSFDPDDSVLINDTEYYRITSNNLVDFDTFKSSYREIFTESFIDNYSKGKTHIVFLEDGKGYYLPSGRGSNLSVGSVVSYSFGCNGNEGYIKVIAEIWYPFVGNEVTREHEIIGYKEHTFDLNKEDDVWKFDKFYSIR